MQQPEQIHQQEKQTDPDLLPFVAPCNKLPLWAAFDWLRLAWSDFRAAPRVSLIYGGGLMLVSYLLAFMSWQLGGAILLLSLLSGLVFIAPVLALGLYSVSCQLETGHNPKLAFCLREGKRHLGNEMIFSVVLLIVFLVWARAGSAMHIFFPMESQPALSEYIIFYGIGSAVGAVFAVIVFSASAFSLPMMMDRRADAITAVLTSVNAVRNNKLPMLVWGSVLVLSVLICFASAFLGMLVLMPLLGYATWHGYKQTIVADQWPENVKLGEHNPHTEHADHS